MKKKLVAALMTAVMVAGTLAGCGGDSNSTSKPNSESKTDSSASASTGDEKGGSDEKITLKLFSNLPDRNNGQGLVEQTIIDEYMAENQNVTIEVEELWTRKHTRQNSRHIQWMECRML